MTNGQLPDAVQLEDQRTQAAIDTQSFLPVQSCMNAAHYSTSDYLARPLDYWKVDGVQEALPFAVSAPILFYNQLAFTKAGLNPASPPTTLPQMMADAKALKASGSGMGLVLDPWHLETWLASANQLFVNNQNGRKARATKGVFVTKTGQADLHRPQHPGAVRGCDDQPVERSERIRQPARDREWQVRDDHRQLRRPGDRHAGPGAGPVPEREIGHRRFPGPELVDQGRDRAGRLGRVHLVQGAGHRPGGVLGVPLLPVQSRRARPRGPPVPAISRCASRPRQTATITHLWTTDPGYKVAYDEINGGVNDAATSGSVIGPYADVRIDVLNAEESMYTMGVSPTKALAGAQSAVNSTISSYNQRLGVG